MAKRPLILLLLAGVAGAGVLAYQLGRDAAPPPTPVQTATVPVPPPPPPPTEAAVPGGEAGLIQVATPEKRTLTEEEAARLVQFADRTGTEALLVWHLGALQLEHYGRGKRASDLLEGRGLQAGLLTLLAGRALADGTLGSIDRPLGEILTEWAGDRRGAITVRHLLTGTSGLNPPAGDPRADAAAWALGATQAVEPGSRFAPSDLEAQLLSIVLGRASGKGYPAYLSQALWAPIGARPGSLGLDATGRTALGWCCFQAIARDWLRVGLLLKDGGAAEGRPVVPTPWVDDIQKPTLFTRNQGLRVLIAWPFEKGGQVKASEPFVDPDTVFLAGEGGQRIYVSEAADLVILRLGEPVADWDDAKLPNMVARAIARPKDRPLVKPVGQGVELPPITKPPKIPTVEVVPLAPQAAPAATQAPAPSPTAAAPVPPAGGGVQR
ncbi:MAG TPA: serine hydrolase [Azospirillaceae bacterium]|nr:serine hydrolase [Azospirillaceae bacterium]